MNQTLPSGPRVMPAGVASVVRSRPIPIPAVNSVNSCLSVVHAPRRPGLAPALNQRALSPPWAMPVGRESAVSPVRNSLMLPSVLTRPMAAGSSDSVKYSLPSDAATIWFGAPVRLVRQKHGASGFAGSKLSMRLSSPSIVSHSWPSGPAVMSLSVSLPDRPALNSS